MTEKNADSAVAYYRAMTDKDLTGMARDLHPDVRLVSPMEELTEKEAVLAAVKPLINLIKSIKVNAKFGSEDQAMLTYDMEFAEPIGVTRTAVLMTFKEGLIERSELFLMHGPSARNREMTQCSHRCGQPLALTRPPSGDSTWITGNLGSWPEPSRLSGTDPLSPIWIASAWPTNRPESRLSIPSQSVFSGTIGCGSNTKI